MAFFFTLATLPALLSLLTLLPYLPIENLDSNIETHIIQNFPGETGNFILNIAKKTLANKEPTLLSISFLLSVLAASTGMAALVKHLNIAFEVQDTRNYFYKQSLGFILTFLLLLLMISATLLALLSTEIIQSLDLAFGENEYLSYLFTALLYLVAFAVVNFTFSVFYRLAPHTKFRYRYLTHGSLTACSLLIVFTMLFDFYISNVSYYNKMYGSLASVIAYMIWLFIASFVLLLGAKIDTIHRGLKA